MEQNENTTVSLAKELGISEEQWELLKAISDYNILILQYNSCKHTDTPNQEEILNNLNEQIQVTRKALEEKYPNEVTFNIATECAEKANSPADSRQQFTTLEELSLHSLPEGIDLNRNPDLKGGENMDIKITPIEAKEPRTRYVVGETLYGISFFYKNEAPLLGVRFPYLYDLEEPSDVKIVRLTVKEHHRVQNEFAEKDSEPTCDGFVLQDDAGNIWHNQYPFAAYGQLSDNCDRVFNRHADSKEMAEQLIAENAVTSCHLLTDFFRNISKGVSMFEGPEALEKAEDKVWFNERLSKMKAMRDRVETMMLVEHHQRLVEKPIWEKHPDITHFVVVPA